MQKVKIFKKTTAISALLLMVLLTSGCASVQWNFEDYWKNRTASVSDKQGELRADALQKYGYSGQYDEIFAETLTLTPFVAMPGDNMRYELHYGVLSPQKNKKFVISEMVVLSGNGETITLAQRQTEKPQGSHISTMQFDIPKDLDPGTYKIITTISSGNLKKTVQGEFIVKR